MSKPKPHSPCMHCLRARQIVSLLLLVAVAFALLAWGVIGSSPSRAQSMLERMATPPTRPAVADCRPEGAAPECAPQAEALELDVPFAYLPSGRVGRPYRAQVSVTGGSPGYRFQIVDGAPPPGLTLGAEGMLAGTPRRAGTFRFGVTVRDSSEPPQDSRRAYLVRVHAQPQATAPARAQSPRDAASAPAVRRVDDPGLMQKANDNEVLVYELRQKDIDMLLPDEEAAAGNAGGEPAGTTAGDGMAEASLPDPTVPVLDPELYQKLRDALGTLQGIEYPTRLLFEAALEQRIAKLDSAQCKKTPCVPKSVIADVITAAERHYPFKLAKTPLWTGGGCGCRLEDLTGTLYGFQPFWDDAEQPRAMDFSVLTRVGYFALPFDAFGNLPQPMQWNAAHADFVREAHKHGTRVDLVLYRNRWDALLKLSDQTLDTVARQVPRHAVQLIRMPLQGWRAELWRHLPLFAEQAQMGDGITVFFDGLPGAADPVLQERFKAFFERFMLTLIEEMRRSGGPYALNLVIPAPSMGQGPFEFEALGRYMRAAEDPWREDEQNATRGAEYRSRTNLTLQFLVLMPEPVTLTKRMLRLRIEESPLLHGDARRAFLRKVIPVLPGLPADAQQMGNDLVYFEDNFGGAGFWPVPRPAADDGALAAKLREVYQPPDASGDGPVCRFVCPNRWPLRLAFELLLLVGVVSLGAYALDCRLRRLGRGYLLFVIAGGVPTLLLSAALLSCDPALASMRQGNTLLVVLIVLLIGWVVVATLRRQVPRP